VFGFLIAVALFALRFLIRNELLETALVDSIHFLLWWYVAAGVVTISLGALAWAGDLGTEGARLRHGVSSALAWMLGLPRLSLRRKSVLYYLMLRRVLLGLGAILLAQGLQPIGATFAWDERYLWAGAVLMGVGLIASVFLPVLRKLLSAPPQLVY